MHQEQLILETKHPRFFFAIGENSKTCYARARSGLDACVAAGEYLCAPLVGLVEVDGSTALLHELLNDTKLVSVD